MPSVNKIIAIGTLGKDVEVRYTSGGDAVANWSIACNESWKDKTTGEKKESVEWIRCTAFGRTAEVAGEYLRKGNPCYVEGRLRTRKYEKDGVEKYVTEVMVDRLQLLGGKPEGSESSSRSSTTKPVAKKSVFDFDDDIPF